MLRKLISEARADPVAVGLATLGAAEGVFNYYIKPEITAKRTWALIGAVVLAHEIISPPGELLSEGADRALSRHPILTRAAIGLTALHLANVLPEPIDPFSRLTKFLKREAPR